MKKNGEIEEGWAWAGKKPDYWITIKPDKDKDEILKPVDIQNNSKNTHSQSFNFLFLDSLLVKNAWAEVRIGTHQIVSAKEIEFKSKGESLPEEAEFSLFSFLWTSAICNNGWLYQGCHKIEF